MYKCTFGGCKCWLECFQYLNLYFIQLNGDLRFLNVVVHIGMKVI